MTLRLLPTSKEPLATPPAPPASPVAPIAVGHQDLVRRVHRTYRRRALLAGGVSGLAAFVVLATLAVVLSGWVPSWGLFLKRLLPLGVLAAVLVPLWRKWPSNPRAIATDIGRRLPELSFDVLGALELSRALRAPGLKDAFSPTLAQRFIEEVNARAEATDTRRAAGPLGLKRYFGALFLCLSLALLLWFAFPMLRQAGWAHLFPDAAGVVTRPPITSDVTLTYTPPAYTGLPPRTVPGTNGEVTALAGTAVRLRTRADRDVERAELRMTAPGAAETRVPLAVTHARDLEGEFVVGREGHYRFVFLDAQERTLAEGPDIPVRLDMDHPPKVTLVAPKSDLEVKGDERLALQFQTSDDFGLAKFFLVVKPAQASEKRWRLSLQEPKRAAGKHVLEVQSLSLAPGEEATYWFEAFDNNNVTGPGRGVSATHRLRVYSPKAHRRAALARAQALWERLVGHLADRMEGSDRQKNPAREALRQGADRDESGRVLSADLASTGRELQTERDAPAGLSSALLNTSHTLATRVGATRMARLGAKPGASRGRTSSGGLLPALEAEIQELEHSVLYLEMLVGREETKEVQTLAREIAAERRALASALDAFRKAPSPEAQKHLLEKARALRARLGELLAQMAALSKTRPEEHLSPEALEAEGLENPLAELERSIESGDADAARRALDEVGLAVSGLERALEAASGDVQRPDPALAQAMNALHEDLNSLEQAQRDTAQDTQRLKTRLQAELQKQVGKKTAQLRERLQKEAEALQQAYRDTASASLPPGGRRALERIGPDLEALVQSLKAQELDMAKEAVTQVEDAARDVASAAAAQASIDRFQDAPGERQKSSEQASERAQHHAARAIRLREQIEALSPPVSSVMGEADKSALKKLADRQRDLSERAQGLSQKLKSVNAHAPVFGPKASEMMDDLARHMNGAQQQLGARDPVRGHRGQRAALDTLERFRKELQRGGGQGGGMPLPMFAGGEESGGMSPDLNGRSNERVELPDPDAFQAPREFREDLLEAMKQGAPERYREQVKRYYEELVR
ncbi:MAG: DUF4175 family protein [Myxococcaceae bacterium]